MATTLLRFYTMCYLYFAIHLVVSAFSSFFARDDAPEFRPVYLICGSRAGASAVHFMFVLPLFAMVHLSSTPHSVYVVSRAGASAVRFMSMSKRTMGLRLESVCAPPR